MDNLLERNKKHLLSKKVFFPQKNALKNLVSALNKDKIAIVSGMRYSGKTKFILDMIKKTNAQENVFYFNSEVDTSKKIHTSNDLDILLELHKRIESEPKLIVLQNINKIEGIKSYIGELYKKRKYKIIIVGNNIKIGGIKEIEIFPLKIEKIGTDNIENILQYGQIEEVQLIRDLYFKNFLLRNILEHIVLRDIIYTYDIKNTDLYYQVISYMSQLDRCVSLRELHRELQNHGVTIALMTLTDYVDASIKSKLLRKVSKYDIKTRKEISSKIQYYFADVGLRNLLTETPHLESLRENIILNELEKKGYSVHRGINGRFEMTFQAKKGKTLLSIHFHNSDDKNELKKDARKLTKLGDDSQKFLVVKDKEVYNMRKYFFEDAQIVEIGELVKYL